MQEIWKEFSINGRTKYLVSNLGRVKNVRSKVVRKPKLDKHGYYVLGFGIKYKKKHIHIHRLVAQAFIPNLLDKPCVNHINGIKTDNRVENLEWVTYKENSIHAYYTGLFSNEVKEIINKTLYSNSMKSRKQIIQYKDNVEIGRFESIADAGRKNKIKPCEISNVLRGRYKSYKGYTFKYANKSQ